MAIWIRLFLFITGQLVLGAKTPLFAHSYDIKAIKTARESASPLNHSKNDFFTKKVISLLRRTRNSSHDGSRDTQSTVYLPNGEEYSITNLQVHIRKLFVSINNNAEKLNFKDPDKMRSYLREWEENWNRTYIAMKNIDEAFDSLNPDPEKNHIQTVDGPKLISDITYSLDNIQESRNNDFSESTRLDTGIHTSSFDATNTESTLVASRTNYPVKESTGSPTGIHTLSPDEKKTESKLVTSTTYYPVMENSGSPTGIHTLPSDENETESRLVASTTNYPVMENSGSPTGRHSLPSDEKKTEGMLVVFNTYNPVITSFHYKKEDVSEKNEATDVYELLNNKSYLTTVINQTEKYNTDQN